MDDQRCELPHSSTKGPGTAKGGQVARNSATQKDHSQSSSATNSLMPPTEIKPSVSTENLFDILQRVQGSRIDEQRSSMQPLPGLDPACKCS